MRTPNGGIQPQAVMDDKGNLHLIYLKGDPKAEDIFYVRKDAGKEAFSAPVRVNSQPGSATAMGTIRGAQIALGKGGRAHVVWNGVMGTGGDAKQAAMFYTRLNDQGAAFEPQRNLITSTIHLDGGGSIAADAQGNVYVFWHASTPENKSGEMGRALYVAQSSDDGKTFAPEKRANTEATGACACCGTKALATGSGLFVVYRAAKGAINRDMTLLFSRDRGASFQACTIHPWRIGKCPMSSESLFNAGPRVLLAWETDEQVYFTPLDAATGRSATPIAAPGQGKRKHPAIASNARCEILLAWAENTAWQKGGSVAWQVFDRDGKPLGEKGSADGLPTWSLVAACAKPDGNFILIY
ncbi:MAG: hypothetical protein HY300_01745 [Verrucomicrobia bacterium]|nr:hypothetical protein [Verrucomicrobiota bacterium]